MDDLLLRLVSDELWAIVGPSIPAQGVPPQGGGPARRIAEIYKLLGVPIEERIVSKPSSSSGMQDVIEADDT